MSTKDAPISRQGTNVSDVYDHEIALVDSTVSTESQGNDEEAVTRVSTSDPRWRDLARRVTTKSSMREELARRKYAKWQEGKYSTDGSQAPQATTSSSAAAEASESDQEAPASSIAPPETEETDFAPVLSSAERGRDAGITGDSKQDQKTEAKAKKVHKHKHHKEVYEVDLLYENQRGWFFCGIPLYSHSSLLNFDPAPWVTKDFKDSAVNITNAQVPDPTWEWDWKSWYVDMSYDVDEEGWQYSFSFSPKFSWHGTHPWLHSFVRRRRWLRKRVQRHHTLATGVKPSSMSQAHVLTSDYFTIHPKRNRSRSTDRNTNARSSYISVTASTAEPEIVPEDIKDIPTLMKALKKASIDREKIDAIRHFVSQGGEELTYLKDSIPEIVSFFIFQNSRRQLLSYLRIAADEAYHHRQDHHGSQDKPESEEEKRRIDNLLAAVEAANEQIAGLEYWSDRKHVMQTVDHDEDGQHRPDTSHESNVSKESDVTRERNPMALDEIKGIPEKAAVGYDPSKHLARRAVTGDEENTEEVFDDALEWSDVDKGESQVEDESKTEDDDEAQGKNEHQNDDKAETEAKTEAKDEDQPESSQPAEPTPKDSVRVD